MCNARQWRIQDLRKGGAKSIKRKARAQNFKPRPKIGDHAHQLTRSWRQLADKEGCFRPSGDEKQQFRERISQGSEFIVGSSY